MVRPDNLDDFLHGLARFSAQEQEHPAPETHRHFHDGDGLKPADRLLTKARMAMLLKTSRTQVDRLLDAENDITLSSLQRAAAMVGRRVRIDLV